ncbi:hypothetical protein ACFSC3_08040 [Sphingomonas floccifaciens]|uniref:Uncharacterized protein n=1 Tax=Sphingomonas floccifaciens TaxID=1844115 RepID=A0ABW4NBU9_9SPHN
MFAGAGFDRRPDLDVDGAAVFAPADPLEPDGLDDLPIVTSHRRLQRLATVSAATGARFAEDGMGIDPVDWLTAPQALFRGAAAIDACQNHDGFLRATILHGLRLRLDAGADEMDELLEEGDDVDDDGFDDEGEPVQAASVGGRLFTCFIDGLEFGRERRVQAFCASVQPDPKAMRRHLARRFGSALTRDLVIVEGIDLDHPSAGVLVPDGLLGVLALAESEPQGEFGRGLDIVLERRFAA